jgi:hypothetical protein
MQDQDEGLSPRPGATENMMAGLQQEVSFCHAIDGVEGMAHDKPS